MPSLAARDSPIRPMRDAVTTISSSGVAVGMPEPTATPGNASIAIAQSLPMSGLRESCTLTMMNPGLQPSTGPLRHEL